MNYTTEQVKKRLKDTLEKEEDVLFCYLFGSFARGDVINESDIDIAVFLKNNSGRDFFDVRLDLMERTTRALKKETDVIILNNASPFLRYAILREGILVFELDPSARLDFELKSTNEYFDYNSALKIYRERLLNST